MENIRSFIAIEISAAVRQELKELLADFLKAGADVKWVRPEGIHLTLKFLGSVGGDLLEKIVLAVRPVIEDWKPFQLKAKGIGCFPGIRNPRVVWIGLGQEGEAVTRLQREIESKTFELGFAPEGRPFQPHLTLGRVRSSKGKNPLIQMIERKSDLDLGSFLVDRVILFRSDLRPAGAVYTKLHEFFMSGV
jgi:RNA 2',3'-cyclic 3'-phosphodiesterase